MREIKRLSVNFVTQLQIIEGRELYVESVNQTLQFDSQIRR